jgi:hypothetical protein
MSFESLKHNRWTFATLTGLCLALAFIAAFFVTSGAELWKQKWSGIVYNVSFLVVFPIFALELLLAIYPLTREQVIREAPWIAIYAIALALVFLRLRLDWPYFSGHMIWLPILIGRLWTSKAPRFIWLLLAMVTFLAVTMKFALWHDYRAASLGLVIGAALSITALVLSQRYRKKGLTGA